jgi:hypothetical protein
MAESTDNSVNQVEHGAPRQPRPYEGLLVVLGALLVFVIGVLLVLEFAIK